MQRYSRLLAPALVAPSRFRLTFSSVTNPSQLSTLKKKRKAVSTRAYGTTSAPKAAEAASAQSGGPRSKDAVEEKERSGSSPTEGVVPDALAEGDARGRTGGGEPLDSSQAPPAKPKIYNASVHGGTANMTDEQKAEVEAHNKDFEKKHGKAQPAGDDKVDGAFWSGKGSRTS
ncbi:hypothetical protein B0T25DRAFT_545358 [Lasiosphaeria hispida]|uniref:Uncharacterized protein n=1 Tax=Lasiosphaeria hispida TaxID=260671 RepID=A0AAJ0MET7_9PEZI|nr:hypothetical protein B0T25DRAFT_545358 [Lasiosphaeria hispida]